MPYLHVKAERRPSLFLRWMLGLSVGRLPFLHHTHPDRLDGGLETAAPCLTPTREVSGQTAFRICSGGPHAARSASVIWSSGSVSFAAMNRCVEDHVRR